MQDNLKQSLQPSASSLQPASLYLALTHYPVVNRNGATIASAITNLDLHDLARLSCSYGIATCYIITPLKDQQTLAQELIDHWCQGIGKELHPNRCEALHRLRLVASIEQVVEDLRHQWGQKPVIWATSAQPTAATLTYRAAREQLRANAAQQQPKQPKLLLLGTAWGLAPSVIDRADAVLEAISEADSYNHLSVRCAAAIMIDRLLGGSRHLTKTVDKHRPEQVKKM